MSLVKMEFTFPNLKAKVEGARREIDLFIAAQMQFNRGMLFDQEGAYNGHSKWAPLRFRNGQILSQRGVLRKSIAPAKANGQPGPNGIVEFNGDITTIGTNLYYANMMNHGTTNMPGGVLRPTKAQALRIPLPQGKKATDFAKNKGKEYAKKKKKMEKTIQKRKYNSLGDFAKFAKQQIKHKIKGIDNTRYMFLKSVKIPARRFDDWTDQDQRELSEALINKIARILNR